MSAVRVSICVPTWNGATHLAGTLASALAQTLSDVEVLVVDDGSSDATCEIVAGVGDPRVRLLHNQERLGIPGNWNRCLREARGEFVQVLCQDDVLVPSAVERLLEAGLASPDAPLAFGRREIQRDSLTPAMDPMADGAYQRALARFEAAFRVTVTGEQLVAWALDNDTDLTWNLVGEPSFVLLRRAVALAAGGFDVRFRQIVDWELWLRLGRGRPLAIVDDRLGSFRLHQGSQSVRNHRRLRTRWELLELVGCIRRLYAAGLTPIARRRLRALRWRYARHLARGAVEGLAGRGW